MAGLMRVTIVDARAPPAVHVIGESLGDDVVGFGHTSPCILAHRKWSKHVGAIGRDAVEGLVKTDWPLIAIEQVSATPLQTVQRFSHKTEFAYGGGQAARLRPGEAAERLPSGNYRRIDAQLRRTHCVHIHPGVERLITRRVVEAPRTERVVTPACEPVGFISYRCEQIIRVPARVRSPISGRAEKVRRLR